MSKASEGKLLDLNAKEVTVVEEKPDQSAALWVRILWSPTVWSLSTLLLLCTIFSILRPDAFLTFFNIRSIAIATSSFLIMGVGGTYVLSAGGLDLSVGSVLVMSGVIGARLMGAIGGESWPTIIVGLVVCLLSGAVVGLVNGVLSSYFRIPALVVTLGTSFAALGLAYVLSGGQDLRTIPDLTVYAIGLGSLLGIPYLVWVAAIVAVIGTFVYSTTRFGRYTYAIGSNEEAARRAGIPVNQHLVKLYTMAGTLSGLAGFLNLAEFGTTTLAGHNPDFLYVLLAIILGGTSLFGGVGTVAGTALAAFIPWVLNDGFIILGVDPYWQFVTLGLIFVVIVYLDALRRRAREKVRH